MTFSLKSFLWMWNAFASILPGTQADETGIWELLNQKVDGNLHRAYPFALPCFSTHEGKPWTPNATACAQVQENYISSPYRAEIYNGFMYNQDEMCPSNAADQCLLNYNDPTDPAAFTNISCNQGSVSDYYIEAISHKDVVSALSFSRKTGIKLSIKNSGHDFFGRNTRKDSLALWTRKLGGLSRDEFFVPEGCSEFQPQDTITTGAGVNFDEVYQFADAGGVTFIRGYAPTVGTTGGWLQGGGHSVLSIVHGLGIDRVLEFKIITPDGVLRTANSCQHPDLFWALRGGGGGTFGVVMSATHAVEPKIQIAVAAIIFNQTTSNIGEWLKIIVDNSLQWAIEGWGGHYQMNNLINVTPLLSLEEAQMSVEAASSFALANNGSAVVEVLPSWYAFYTKYVISNAARIARPTILASRLIPDTIFETVSGRADLLAFLNKVISLGLVPYIPNTTPYLYPWTSDSTSATPAWRGSVWHLSFGSLWAYNGTVSERIALLKLLDQVLAELEELVPGGGAYLNEADPWTKDWKQKWWGTENYEKLHQIKKKYDPDNLLSCWKCVGFKDDEADEEFPCFAGLDDLQVSLG